MTIDEKIRVAQDFFTRWGDELWGDPSLRNLLEALRGYVMASRRANLELGFFEACRHCDEEEEGSCCGAGIENRYSPHLLLINLLLGQTLPENRYSTTSCHFLGKDGCSLLAREILCINYLCTKIQKSFASEELFKLQAVTGQEMEAIFKLEVAVKTFITARS